MRPSWFKPRGYKHLDVPVGESFAARVADPKFVATHSWLPLIHYEKTVRRYSRDERKTVIKHRDIMYASHRDACILAKYASEITSRLDTEYNHLALGDHVIAYRKLGKSNYHFSANVREFAMANAPCVVLCFDVSGFFDHLDHRILKDRLKRLLGASELPSDWYSVFRHVTAYRRIARDDLAADAILGPRLDNKAARLIGTIAEVKAAGVKIRRNGNSFGIPQGTPISSALSNLYMIDVDRCMAELCASHGALYRRYSDDILIICKPPFEAAAVAALTEILRDHRLELKDTKTDRKIFDHTLHHEFQYLGFNVSPSGAVIRPASLARQWRRAKRAISRTKDVGLRAMVDGRSSTIHTKRLRGRFSPVGARNFSAYARRAAHAFQDKKILRQVLRWERMADQAIRDLKALTPPPP